MTCWQNTPLLTFDVTAIHGLAKLKVNVGFFLNFGLRKNVSFVTSIKFIRNK